MIVLVSRLPDHLTFADLIRATVGGIKATLSVLVASADDKTNRMGCDGCETAVDGIRTHVGEGEIHPRMTDISAISRVNNCQWGAAEEFDLRQVFESQIIMYFTSYLMVSQLNCTYSDDGRILGSVSRSLNRRRQRTLGLSVRTTLLHNFFFFHYSQA